LFVWADNFFVAAYTLFFIAAGARTFLALRPSSRTQALALRWLFGLALTTAVLGGLCDYIENFWLLAHIGSAADYSAELASVAAFTAWKFRFFALNLLAVIAWSVAMRCDHRR
jgi:hypothetical protein